MDDCEHTSDDEGEEDKKKREMEQEKIREREREREKRRREEPFHYLSLRSRMRDRQSVQKRPGMSRAQKLERKLNKGKITREQYKDKREAMRGAMRYRGRHFDEYGFMFREMFDTPMDENDSSSGSETSDGEWVWLAH